jgi:hypothetical protein
VGAREEVVRPPTTHGRKRGVKSVWLPVRVQVLGEGNDESGGKRPRTSSVFERLEEPGMAANSVFNRLEDPSADPARQGRRDQ